MKEENNNDSSGIEVKDFTVRMGKVTIGYKENEAIKSILAQNPHEEFLSAIQRLVPIFAFHMQLDGISQNRLTVIGLEISDNKDLGLVYKITGILECGNRNYKLTTGILAPKPDSFFEEEISDDFGEPAYRRKEDYLYIIDETETSIILDALEEAKAFINGKRKPDEQGTFDFEGEEDGQDDFSDL